VASSFTVLVPGVVGFFLPSIADPSAQLQGGWWDTGWILVAAGSLIYALCLIRFLAAGGTPAIFFARHLRLLLGEEPAGLVSGGLSHFSRNPMYVGVLLVVFGQATLFASPIVAAYGCAVFLFFHSIVVFVEEPHLRATRGNSYDLYLQGGSPLVGPPEPSLA
jgi:protein-S-isoprenylcysteine O-methyltransferase Ste14